MSNLLTIILYSGFSGFTVFLGGLFSNFYGNHFKESNLKREINHFVIAFGGGIILAALALVLIPRGMEDLTLLPIIFWFLLGAIVFFFLDQKLEKSGSKVSQLLAMLLDFIPEAIALGALFATHRETGTLLAVFIGLQNFPESFNSFQDLKASGFPVKKSLSILFALSFVGIIGAVSGYLFLTDLPQVTASLMIFSSGGILYLIFQDIAPNVRLERSWMPALGANLGFLIGIIGEKLI